MASAESEHVLRTLLDNLPDAYALCEVVGSSTVQSTDLRLLRVNRAFAELAGLPAEVIVGRQIAEVLPGVTETDFVRVCGRVAQGGQPARFVVTAGPLGRRCSVNAFAVGPGQLATVFTDVTEHVKVKQTLQRYQMLARQTRDIILFVRHSDGRIIEASAAAARAYGYTCEELLDMTIADLRSTREQSRVRDQMDQANSDGILFETEHRRRNGALFPVEVNSLGADIDGERVLVSIVRDITERKRAERLRDEFADLAAHEMQTPLAVLKGYLQVLLREGSHSERERHHFEVLKAQVDRMTRLVQTLISTISLQSSGLAPRLARVNLGDFVRRAVEAVQDVTADVTICLRCDDLASDGVVIELDPEQLCEVLVHLLGNAIRYSPPRGTIEVRVWTAPTEAIVSVRDQGPGISPDRQQQLFEPYYQVSPMTRPTTGMGLGLYISREILRRHGGRIWVESEEGSGSTFSFALPLQPTAPEDQPTGHDNHQAARGEKTPPTGGG